MVPAPQPQRIGLFGGAFDPPHWGHWALAKVAIAQLKLDALHIVPTGQATNKKGLTAGLDRLALCHLAFAELDKAVVDDREIKRRGPSYTLDTLLELQQQFAPCALFLIVGQDQAEQMHTWFHPERIRSLATVCMAERGLDNASFGAHNEPMELENEKQAKMVLTMPRWPQSSSTIRLSIAQKQNVGSMVSDPVARYIAQHHLYINP